MNTKLSNYLALSCFAVSLIFAGRAVFSPVSVDSTGNGVHLTDVSASKAPVADTVPIEDIQLGMRVLAHNPEESEEDLSLIHI